jgi:hypothetical protein
MQLADIIYSMDDGIHHVRDFLMVDDSVHYISPKDRTLDLTRQLLPIPRDTFIDTIDSVAGDDWELMESLYGKYNSFAMEPGTNRYYAWYDNCR